MAPKTAEAIQAEIEALDRQWDSLDSQGGREIEQVAIAERIAMLNKELETIIGKKAS